MQMDEAWSFCFANTARFTRIHRTGMSGEKPERTVDMKSANTILLDQSAVKSVADIDAAKAVWEVLTPTFDSDEFHEWTESLFAREVGTTMRLRGVKISDKEVDVLLSAPDNAHLKIGQRKSLAYAGALQDIVLHAGDMPFNEETVKGLYRQLMKGEDNVDSGEYKSRPNKLPGFGKIETPRTASPKETPKRMRELLGWVNAALSQNEGHPLVVIQVFIAAFLSISPFQHGNGRLCRLLAALLLIKSGYGFIAYGSMGHFLEPDAKELRRALLLAYESLKAPKWEWTVWMAASLKPMAAFANELRQKVEQFHLEELGAETARNAYTLPELSTRILEFAERNGRVTMNAIIRETGKSRPTLKGHFRRLVEKGELTRHGKGRGVWYCLPVEIP